MVDIRESWFYCSFWKIGRNFSKNRNFFLDFRFPESEKNFSLYGIWHFSHFRGKEIGETKFWHPEVQIRKIQCSTLTTFMHLIWCFFNFFYQISVTYLSSEIGELVSGWNVIFLDVQQFSEILCFSKHKMHTTFLNFFFKFSVSEYRPY